MMVSPVLVGARGAGSNLTRIPVAGSVSIATTSAGACVGHTDEPGVAWVLTRTPSLQDERRLDGRPRAAGSRWPDGAGLGATPIDALNVFPVADADRAPTSSSSCPRGPARRRTCRWTRRCDLSRLSRTARSGGLAQRGRILAQDSSPGRTFEGLDSAGPATIIRRSTPSPRTHRALAAPVEGTIVTRRTDAPAPPSPSARTPRSSTCHRQRCGPATRRWTRRPTPARAAGNLHGGAGALPSRSSGRARRRARPRAVVHPEWMAARAGRAHVLDRLEGFVGDVLVRASHRRRRPEHAPQRDRELRGGGAGARELGTCSCT
jgi:hypothetical protein